MPQSFASLYVHLVFSTKNREPRIHGELPSRLFEYLGGILRNHGCHLIGAGGRPDHVHLLASLARLQQAHQPVAARAALLLTQQAKALSLAKKAMCGKLKLQPRSKQSAVK